MVIRRPGAEVSVLSLNVTCLLPGTIGEKFKVCSWAERITGCNRTATAKRWLAERADKNFVIDSSKPRQQAATRSRDSGYLTPNAEGRKGLRRRIGKRHNADQRAKVGSDDFCHYQRKFRRRIR